MVSLVCSTAAPAARSPFPLVWFLRICIVVNLTVISGPTHYGKAGNPIPVESAGAAPAVPEPKYTPPVAAAAPMKSYAAPSAASGYGGPARPYGGAVVATASDAPRHVPLASLNPYNNKWTIKVRCVPVVLPLRSCSLPVLTHRLASVVLCCVALCCAA